MKNITLQTKISELLQEYPQVEDTLVSLSPSFAKLKNPILRKTIAKVTSLQQAASITGLEPNELVVKIRVAAGLSPTPQDELQNSPVTNYTGAAPQWYSPSKVVATYNATEVLNTGNIPMGHILEESRKLIEGQIFQFTSPFLPQPILDLLAKEGFTLWSDKREEGKEVYYQNNVYKPS